MDNPRTTPNKGIKLFLYFLGTVEESGVQSLHKYLHFLSEKVTLFRTHFFGRTFSDGLFRTHFFGR
jgi:hypothetical protein